MATRLPKGYTPSEKEPFMNAKQKEFFRRKLLAWRNDIIQETKETLNNLQKEVVNFSDLADRASSETDRSLELRARDRQRKLISKIDEALSRIDDGSYGYCEETGENIGLKRLIARPIATLSIDSQERHEKFDDGQRRLLSAAQPSAASDTVWPRFVGGRRRRRHYHFIQGDGSVCGGPDRSRGYSISTMGKH